MKNNKRKMLPKKDAPNGLYLFCNSCKRWYKHDGAVECNCPLTYKAKVHVPGTKRKSKCKSFTADSPENAIQTFLDFKKELKATSFQLVSIKKEIKKPIFLTDCQADFMDFKKDIGVDFQDVKNLPRRNIRHAERALEYFNEALFHNNIDVEILRFEEINSTIVSFISKHFLNYKDMANKTYNNNIAPIKTFMRYIIKKYYPNMENPFENIKKLTVVTEKKVISKAEFMSVVNLVKPENLLKKEKTRVRDLYRPWLIDGFYLAMLGGRNEEVTNIRWNHIKLNEEGQMSYIEVVDLKRTRNIKQKSKLKKDTEIKKRIEMTTELEDLLVGLGYNEKKGTQEYVLANEEKVSRKYMSEVLSAAFNYLLAQLNLAEKKEFKHLRKTYATKCYLEDPVNFYKKMGHTNENTTLEHYVDMVTVMEIRRKKLYEQKGR